MEFTALERGRIDSISENSKARDMKTFHLPNHKKVGLEKLQPQLIKMNHYRVTLARKLKPPERNQNLAKRNQNLERTRLSAKSYSKNPLGIQGTYTAGWLNCGLAQLCFAAT
jgi:hypothetical protein